MSLTMVSLFVNQLIKACTPALTCTFSMMLAGKTYTPAVFASIGMIIVGCVMAQARSFSGDATATPTSPLGVVFCITAMVGAALHPVLTMVAMAGTPNKPKLFPTLVLFYDMCTSFLLMLTYWLCTSEFRESIEYLSTPGQTSIGLTVITTGSFLAFEFNLANNVWILLTSALTAVLSGNFLKIFLIAYAAILAGVHDVLSWSGVGLVIVSVVAYAYFISQSSTPQPSPKPEADSGEAERAEGFGLVARSEAPSTALTKDS